MTESSITPPVDEPTTPSAGGGNRRAVRAWQGLFVLILIGFVGLLAARLIQTRRFQPAGVDHDEADAVPEAVAVDAVARRAGDILDDGCRTPDQAVEEG